MKKKHTLKKNTRSKLTMTDAQWPFSETLRAFYER